MHQLHPKHDVTSYIYRPSPGLNLSSRSSMPQYSSSQFNIFLRSSRVLWNRLTCTLGRRSCLVASVKSEHRWRGSVKDPSGLSLSLPFISPAWQPNANPVGGLSLFSCNWNSKRSQMQSCLKLLQILKSEIFSQHHNRSGMKVYRGGRHARTTDL